MSWRSLRIDAISAGDCAGCVGGKAAAEGAGAAGLAGDGGADDGSINATSLVTVLRYQGRPSGNFSRTHSVGGSVGGPVAFDWKATRPLSSNVKGVPLGVVA